MKPFLTQDQALDLIQAFENYRFENKRDELYIGEVRRVLNQCTIKEFPELVMKDANSNQILIGHWNEKQVCINVPAQYLYMNNDQFIQFADGVAKIAQWIKEHND